MTQPLWKHTVAVLALAGLAGCYDWVPIRPTQLPNAGAGQRDLEQPDGTSVHIDRPAAVVTVDSVDGEQRRFWAPRARVDGRVLTISGDNAPPTQIALDQIAGAEAGTLNRAHTTGAVVICALALGFAALFLHALQFPGP
jgi:hypothetical protein